MKFGDESEGEWTPEEGWRPHLVFLVDGMNGCAESFEYITEKLLDIWGDEIVVHACSANNDALQDILTGEKSFRTCDGIDAGGRRIAKEVVSMCEKWHGDPPLSISFWGHSMGGLYARYAIAELMDARGSGRICGLPPLLFITTACPHIGVAGTFSTPIVATGSAIGVLGASGWLGRSGQQLFFEDEELMLWALACEDRYVQALEKFQYRALVANVCNDLVVDFCVSALQPRCPSWLSDSTACPALSEEYPHVVYDSKKFNRPLDSLLLDDADCLLPDQHTQRMPSSPITQHSKFQPPHAKRERSKFQPTPQANDRSTIQASPASRERSKFAPGGLRVMASASGGHDNSSSSWLSWLWGSEDAAAKGELVADPSPVIHCSGHAQELRIEEARLRLASLPWRLICMRFDDYPGQNAHDDLICKLPWFNANDGVEYIVRVVMKPVFGSKHRAAPTKETEQSRSSEQKSTLPVVLSNSSIALQ